ncbi:putative glycoprotein 3-alpha-L-fucosyltransferase A-like [Apostichopus japonicus]|uniref:Fucosyltransferase n=2 Tax=Stichopus japonicus TaxID=307972 RepID=A0A2G8KV00_STIJA|nr:putative glycoprotein 3-alpha-L-fucosyltransferase A-like [Apostichopus japonicus]
MALIGNSRIFSPYENQPLAVQQQEKCVKNIVFFGLRQHWLTFCRFPEFARYKYLIKFPRFIECPGTNCSVLLNYTKEPREIRNYDAVVFTNVYQWLTPAMWDWVHGNRTEGQKWVMITEESPLYSPGVQPPPKYENTTFDWFDSYKRDSDFVHPYGVFQPYGDVKPPEENLRKFLQPKKRLLAWMGSHCETLQWNRRQFVDDLAKMVPIDKYGKCGTEEVVWNNDDAIMAVLGKYKFYLSLENSCCDDYITEKFWRALYMGMVPVVVGAPLEHYNKFAPPNSFIHVDQFDSLTDLAVHLLELNGNDEKYLEYFKWRREGRLISFGQEDQYVRPLKNATHCEVLKKILRADPQDQRRLHYFGESWVGSCKVCGRKKWINSYMHPKNYSRQNEDIWA